MGQSSKDDESCYEHWDFGVLQIYVSWWFCGVKDSATCKEDFP